MVSHGLDLPSLDRCWWVGIFSKRSFPCLSDDGLLPPLLPPVLETAPSQVVRLQEVCVLSPPPSFAGAPGLPPLESLEHRPGPESHESELAGPRTPHPCSEATTRDPAPLPH